MTVLGAIGLFTLAAGVRANFIGIPGEVYMRDLGYPEPDWVPITQGSSTEDAIIVNPDTQVWGDIEPLSVADEPLCQWQAGPENEGMGTCKTDISWLHSAVGIKKEFFDDPVTNYIIRFHLNAACYRSTQVCAQEQRCHACKRNCMD